MHSLIYLGYLLTVSEKHCKTKNNKFRSLMKAFGINFLPILLTNKLPLADNFWLKVLKISFGDSAYDLHFKTIFLTLHFDCC